MRPRRTRTVAQGIATGRKTIANLTRTIPSVSAAPRRQAESELFGIPWESVCIAQSCPHTSPSRTDRRTEWSGGIAWNPSWLEVDNEPLAPLLLRVLMSGGAVLVRHLAVFLRRRRVLLGLIVAPIVMMVRCHSMMVRSGFMMRRRIVVMVARSMLRLRHCFVSSVGLVPDRANRPFTKQAVCRLAFGRRPALACPPASHVTRKDGKSSPASRICRLGTVFRLGHC